MPLDEPNMSDKTLLVSVEDLINIAMGPEDKNIVNFKVVQTVLHILARQQRMLQQRVEIRITEVRQESPPPTRPHQKGKKGKESEGSSPSSSPPPPKKRVTTPREEKPKDITKDTTKVDKEKDLKRKEEKEKAKLEKEKEKLEKEKEKQLRAQEKAQLSARKEQEKAEKAQQKELEKAQKEKEKAERLAEKEKEKAERLAEKEKEKAEKMSEKEKEKAEKAAEKEKEKAEKAAEKEKEKAEKAAEKEKEKAEKAAEKEREKAEKAEKAERKERERAEKEAAKAQKEKERGERSPSPAATKEKKKPRVEAVPSINISEVERGKEKVLVVEKGPTTRSDTRGRPIDVVTQSQFALLEATVRSLAQQAAPPALRLPDDQSLKTALARGSASLTDTMQAMQVDARVKAAEAAIARMAELLTQLAAAGAVPPALADSLADAKRDAERTLTSDTDDSAPVKPRPSTARKSVAIDPMAKSASALARPSTATAGRSSLAATPRASLSTVMARASVSQPSSTVTAVPDPKVTRGEMEDIIKSVKDELWKNMNSMTTKATTAAETAAHTAKAVAERLETALKLDGRISTLHALVADYATQLTGFDAGLTTQMQSFQEQMMQIRSDLAGGLKLLDSVNNNAETAAVMELTERYGELASELERTVAAHRALADFQGHLGDELRSLVECVEMLREQKADRDEVIDGLRDKADTSRLAGLLTEAEFARARAELQRRLDVCHDKFRRQDGVWMGAIKELLKTTDLKAEIIDLLSMREDTQRQLRELHDKLRLLAAVLGEPKAALLTRQLARDGSCGACGAAALMGPRDPAQGVPPAIPALRPAPPPPEPCLRDLGDWMPPEPPDDRHMCQRWCGGSHTLVSGLTTRERAPPLDLVVAPTRKFADYGRDGRLYMLEEELQPCKECNVVLEAERGVPVGEEGAGDQGA